MYKQNIYVYITVQMSEFIFMLALYEMHPLKL